MIYIEGYFKIREILDTPNLTLEEQFAQIRQILDKVKPCPYRQKGTDGIHCVVVNRCYNPNNSK